MEWAVGLPGKWFCTLANSFFTICSYRPAYKINVIAGTRRRGEDGRAVFSSYLLNPTGKCFRRTIDQNQDIRGARRNNLCATAGWIRYYSVVSPSALPEVFSVLNDRLVHWYTYKYKRYRRRMRPAREQLGEDYKNFPNLFLHWQYGYTHVDHFYL